MLSQRAEEIIRTAGRDQRAGASRRGDRINLVFAASAHGRFWHETDVLCVPTNFCSWWKSGHAADITVKTDFDPKATLQARRS